MGARTPEELGTLLEDAILLQDIEGLVALFTPEGLLASPLGDAGGGVDTARAARALMSGGWG